MASWTDLIPQFNPYIKQLPVEALVQVGMQKQQMYEQNVQKIQSQIESVAGLDVIKDPHKKYLQSKLDQLGNNLTKLAAADFSNFQMVNSVSGMTNQIVKDKYVQNAVNSTAWYRKQAAEMEKAISEGKSSQANIYDFTERANSWINDGKLETSFNDRYTQYTDVKKKALEAIKLLHPNLQKYDIPFEVKDGKINMGLIADAMQRYKIEGVTEQQISAAIMANLTPDDHNQLAIDAKYQFRGVTPEQLAQNITTTYQNNRKQDGKILEYLIQKRGVETDPVKISVLDERIADYQARLGKDGKPGTLDLDYETNMREVATNPNNVKYSLYKNGFVREFANAYTWKSEEMEYVTNPFKAQENFNKELAHKQAVENRLRMDSNRDYSLAVANYQLAARKLALEEAAANPENSNWTTVGNPTDNELKSGEMFSNYKDSKQIEITNLKNSLTSKYTPQQIEMMLNDPTKAPADVRATIFEIKRKENFLTSLNEWGDQIRNQVEAETGLNDVKRNVVQGRAPITVKWKGQSYTLSPSELLEIQTATKKTISKKFGVFVSGQGNKGRGEIVTVDKSRMNANQIKFINAMEGVLFGDVVTGGGSPDVATIRNKWKEVVATYKPAIDKVNETADRTTKLFNQRIAPYTSTFVPQIKALPLDKDGGIPAATMNKLSQLITSTLTMNRKVAADNTYNPTVAFGMLTSKDNKDTRVYVQQSGDDFEIQIQSIKDPSKLQRIRVNRDEVLANFGQNYVNMLTEESLRVNFGKGNTNLNFNPKRSAMQSDFGDFPGIRRMNVTVDFQQEHNQPNQFFPVINIRKKDGRYQSFSIDNSRLDYSTLRNNLNGLNDETLLNYIRQYYPNYNYSQLDLQ